MNKERILRFHLKLLRLFCPDDLCEEIEGDLTESFENDIKENGFVRAKRKLLFRVLGFCRPGIVFRNKISLESVNIIMLKSYFTISWRYLSKNKTFSLVNILGLALGMAAALLIYQFASFERSFDNFHKQADDIYRVTTVWNKDLTPNDKRARTMPWSGPSVKEAFAEVTAFTRFTDVQTFTGFNAVKYKDILVNDQRIFLADPGFFDIFSFELVSGDARTALNDPTSIVITESSAQKFFKDEDPIGKTLELDSHNNLPESNFKVTGVIKDPPLNSHLDFDFLLSFNIIFSGLHNGSTYWHWDYTYCYLRLAPGTDIHALEKKMTNLRVAQFGKDMTEYKDVIDFSLQPIRDIHLNSHLIGELTVNSDGDSVSFLIIIGLCIIVCAYINYVNISTVKAVERRTEIGIRKVVGSSRFQLVLQLMVESLILNIIALIIAAIMFGLSMPVLENIFNIEWPAWSSESFNLDFFAWLGIVILAGVLLSAVYPAFVLTSFKPAQVLKGSGMLTSQRGFSLRKGLMIVQFVFCIAFTVGTYALYEQLAYMKRFDVGMNMDEVLVVRGYGFQPHQGYVNFKAALSGSPGIQSVGTSSVSPGDEVIEMGLKPLVSVYGKPPVQKELKLATIDEDFFKTLEVDFIAGRNFSMVDGDKLSVILNEAAAHAMGYSNAADIINEELTGLDAKPLRVIGVIRNYNQRSLKSQFEPMVYQPIWNVDFGWNSRYSFIRFTPLNGHRAYQEQIADVERVWKKVNPGKPFQYFFLDSYFDSQYKSDNTITSLFLFFSVFAIFIACLGLFGLVAYITLQRTKEIGVRKVLGASVNNILTLLSGDFVKLLLIASIISIPMVSLFLQRWLDRYAFRIEITAWLLAFPLILIFTVSLLTVIMRSLKVATSNPVDSLKYE